MQVAIIIKLYVHKVGKIITLKPGSKYNARLVSFRQLPLYIILSICVQVRCIYTYQRENYCDPPHRSSVR